MFTKKRVLWALALVAVVSALLAVRAVRAAADGVAGSYLIRATVPPGAPAGFPSSFHLLAVFTSDGTIISTDTTDPDPVGRKGQESPGIGVWQMELSRARANVTMWSFWAHRNGDPMGVLRVRGSGGIDPAQGNKIIGTATFDFFEAGNDPLSGRPDMTFTGGAFEATRLAVVPQ